MTDRELGVDAVDRDPTDVADEGAAAILIDVDDAGFEDAVRARSHVTPVVVDVWAAWCGPCAQLTPALESAVAARGGDVVLARVDADRNPGVVAALGVRSIPHVAGFRDGVVVAQRTGVMPPRQIEAFLDDLLPSAADQAVARARAADGPRVEEELRAALRHDPGHREAAIGLAELLVDDDPQAALELVRGHRPDPAAERVAIRAELAGSTADVGVLRDRYAADPSDEGAGLALARALAAAGDHDEAIEVLLQLVALGGSAVDDARRQLLALFELLGDSDPRVVAARPRLARALF